MGEQNRKEMVIRYSAIGFALGFLMATFFYLVLFQLLGIPFAFHRLAGLHAEYWFLLFNDLVPLIALLIGASLGNWRFRKMDELSSVVKGERERNAEISRFIHSLIEGDLFTKYSFSEIDQTLSGSLNQLKDAMIRNREAERQRRLEERQRNWVSEGLATFGDLLRTHSGEIEPMAYAVLSNMVGYLGANQGAIYITRESGKEKYLDMIACHAYDRKKFPDMKISWGNGLIGAVAMEKKGYYTDKVPDGYLAITSGLGKANPRYLLIEPLVWNQQVFGVIELASFKRMDTHEIQFVSRVAESIATTIHSIENKLRTEQLLKETQAQAEELARKEEQVRNNMDALKLTQEEAAKQADQFIRFTNTVNHTLMRAEYSPDGILLYANTRFLKKMGYSGNREVEGKHISMFIHEKESSWFNSLWSRLAKGGRHYEGYMKHQTKLGLDLWTMATYTCMRREDGEVEKILFIGIDSTDQKKISLDYEGQIEAIDRLNAKAVFAPDGKMIRHNKLYSKIMKYPDNELVQMNIFDFFSTGEQERFNEIWEKVIQGEAFQGQLKMQSKYEEELWFRAALLSTKDIHGEVEKVIFFGNEITREKEMEIASRKYHDQIVRREEELRMTGLDLKKKLDDSVQKRKEEKERSEREIYRYTHILDELPYPLVSINNLGFILFFNRQAEKFWNQKKKEHLGNQVRSLFHENGNSAAVVSFADPVKTKTPGMYPDQVLILPDGRKERKDLLVIRTDMQRELHYTLVII